jgi:hypothetical protein
VSSNLTLSAKILSVKRTTWRTWRSPRKIVGSFVVLVGTPTGDGSNVRRTVSISSGVRLDEFGLGAP